MQFTTQLLETKLINVLIMNWKNKYAGLAYLYEHINKDS